MEKHIFAPDPIEEYTCALCGKRRHETVHDVESGPDKLQLQQEREAKEKAREAATYWMSVARKQKREKDKLLEILKHVDDFISNGIELGYIRKPEPGSPEHNTAKKVREVIWEK